MEVNRRVPASYLTAPDDFNAILDGLQAEPLWHASLGSRELFHSNMLAWMIHQFPKEGRAVVTPWLEPGEALSDGPVSREYRHLDLVVSFEGTAPLVIENKMFGLPDEAQLERYTAAAVRAFSRPTLILLSLIHPGWPSGVFQVGRHLWRWVSYRDLAQRVGEEFPAGRGAFARQVLSHYAGLLVMIQGVADRVALTGPHDRFHPPIDMRQRLDTMRMAEFAGKLRAYEAARQISHRLAEEGFSGIRVPAGFSNGTALIEAFSRLPDGNEVGWQYQNRQWRLAVRLRPEQQGRTRHHKELREQYARAQDWWFDFTPLSQVTGLPLHANLTGIESRGGFNHFAPDFCYRYRRLDNPTIAELAELAVIYARAAGRAFGRHSNPTRT